jgi:hypothetical protein
MDIRKVFRGISKKLLADFEISAQITHNGNIGDYRENSLREFLEVGRLPKRYGVGNGEIVGHISNVSKQSDLIIFDQFESIPLLYDNQVQVYPIDCIYGIVEVKSKLSKTKLLEGLENIKSVKELTPNDYVVKKTLFIQQSYQRPKPFGFIFAFAVDGNSLDSLTKNLAEWEKSNPPDMWPNLIVVLGEGIIYHTQNGFDKRISPSSIDNTCRPTCTTYKDDAFFHFYSYLLDLCNNVELPKVEISKYLNLPQKIGKYIVGNNDRMVKYDKDGKVDATKVFRLNERFVDKIVTWCQNAGPMTNQEMLLKNFGQIPVGTTEHYLKQMSYFYNPDNLKGIHEVKGALTTNEKGDVVVKEGVMATIHYITVDNETYYYPFNYVTEQDSEAIEGREVSDL